jgi:hypothetical protein
MYKSEDLTSFGVYGLEHDALLHRWDRWEYPGGANLTLAIQPRAG